MRGPLQTCIILQCTNKGVFYTRASRLRARAARSPSPSALAVAAVVLAAAPVGQTLVCLALYAAFAALSLKVEMAV